MTAYRGTICDVRLPLVAPTFNRHHESLGHHGYRRVMSCHQQPLLDMVSTVREKPEGLHPCSAQRVYW